MSKPTLTVTTDNTEAFNRSMRSFAGDAVLVGVPAEDTDRKQDPEEKEEITNAMIMAMAEYGSPANNIPRRPVMSIGLRLAKDEIASLLGLAAKQFFNDPKATTYLERAGFAATNSIKKVITQQIDIDPPAESTIKARKARGFKGEKALLVSGQFRNSITFVLTGLWDQINSGIKKAKK